VIVDAAATGHIVAQLGAADAIRELVDFAATAFGIATEIDLRDYFRLPVAETRQAVAELVEAGMLERVTVEGWSNPAFLHRGAAVTIVERSNEVMGTLDPDMGALVADALRNVGIALHLDERVEGFETDGEQVRGVRTSSGVLPADLVILGLGVRPNSTLASEAGITIGATHGIVVDDHMATSIEGIYAAGDCVETHHRVSGQPVAIALGTHANKQGRVVAINATGGDATFPGVIGTAISKICKYEVARTGLNEREAFEAGFDTVAATIEAETRAHYYPGSTPIHVKVVAERGTARLLGAQIVGEEGAAKRVDVLATAVWAAMSAEEFASLDLAYAPPFAPVWDPVLIAARKAAEAANEPRA